MNQLNFNFIVDSINKNQISDFKNKDQNENFNLKYLERYNSQNFKKFSNLFSNHIDRIGIHYYFKNYNSPYFTTLFCIDNDFNLFDINEQKTYINFLKIKLLQDYNLKLNKIENLNYTKLKEIINNKNNDKNYHQLYILSNYFNLNIFLFSYTDNNIICFTNDYYSTYKKNIFLNEINEVIYPLSYKNINGFIFRHNSTILLNLLKNNIIKYNLKDFQNLEDKNNIKFLLEEFSNINTNNITLNYTLDDNISSDEEEIDYDNLIIDNNNITIDDSLSSDEIDNLDIDMIKNLKNHILNITDNNLKLIKKNDLYVYYEKLKIPLSDEFKKKTKKILLDYLKEKIK